MERRQFLSTVGASIGSLSVGTEKVDAGQFLDVQRNGTGGGDDLFLDTSPFPSDPHIVVAHGAPYFRSNNELGWKAVKDRERLRTILGLYPDLLDFHRLLWANNNTVPFPEGVSKQLEFSLSTDLPGTSGQTIYISTDVAEVTERYGWLQESRGWQYPDGEPLESPLGLLGRRFDGEPTQLSVQGSGTGIPSIFAPGTLDIQTFEATAALDAGFSGMFLDSFATPRLKGLDFSRWAEAAFQQHLANLPDARRHELGVEEPESFNIRDYFQSEGIVPEEDNEPRSDPLFREFHLFHHQGLKSYLEAYRSFLSERYPERKANGSAQLYGNQFFGTEMQTAHISVYASDVFDFINIEDNRTLPPEFVRDTAYKLMLAASRFEKPVLFEGQMQAITGNDSTRGLDPTRQFPYLQRLQIAEAYAMGAVRKLPLTSWGNVSEDETITHWLASDGSVPEVLSSFKEFLHANRRFLRQIQPNNEVALVYSVPTGVWTRIPQWNIQPLTHLESFRGAAKLLRESQVTYDVVIFGHPALYSDEYHLRRLTDYDTIVLAGIACLTESQTTALSEAMANDGQVVVSGSRPSRDGQFQPASSVSDLFDHDSVTILPENPARARIDDPGAGDALVNTVGAGVIQVDADETLGVNWLRDDTDPVDQLHFLNYDYDRANDSINTKTDIRITVDLDHFQQLPEIAEYRSPDIRTSIPLDKTDSTVEFTVPQLHEWGFVLFAPEESTIESSTDPSTADAAIESATAALESAKNQGRDWSDGFVRAQVNLSSARTFIEADSYTDAVSAADAAKNWADQSYRQPVIGIDQAHGQPKSQEATDSFEPLRTSLDQFSYRTLSDWEGIDLPDLDILVIPPALEFKGASYGFTPAEVEQIVSFVAEGGSLAVFARGGVASDMGQLLDRFGVGFAGPPIVAPDRSPLPVEPTLRLHALTRGIDAIEAKLATPISPLPEDASVLARVPSHTDAWIHQSGDLWKRDADEPSAAARPIYAVVPFGEGLVAVSGIHYPLYYHHSNEASNLFMGNLFASLAEHAKHSSIAESTQSTEETAGSTIETGTDDPSDGRQSTPSPSNRFTATESPGNPGFGMLTALGGMAGAMGLLKWYRQRDESDD